MLEDEMASIALAADASPGGDGCQKLRRMLELECEAIAASHGGSGARPRGRLRRRRTRAAGDAGVLSGLLQKKPGGGLEVGAVLVRVLARLCARWLAEIVHSCQAHCRPSAWPPLQGAPLASLCQPGSK